MKFPSSFQSFVSRQQYPSDLGKIYYLTIQENMVKSGKSQRRPGLHVDSPGAVKIKSSHHQKDSRN